MSKVQTAVIIIFSVLLFTGIGTSIYFYSKYKSTEGAQTSAEAKSLKERVSKLIELPADEDPAVATVNDVSKLKDQQFFARAKNGDKVLVFSKAQKAILYDPIKNIIIEVGPVVIPSPTAGAGEAAGIATTAAPSQPSTIPSPTSVPSPTKSSSVRVSIYNGTPTDGYVESIESLIKQKTQNVEVVERLSANKTTYDKTIVVDLKGGKAESARTLADIVGGQVGSLPSSEKKPSNADFLVIIGAPGNGPTTKP